MTNSDFVFEKAESITVGSHGDNDFVFAAGNKVTDRGNSSLVFEAGNGIGGGTIIDDFEDGDLSPYSTYHSVTESGGVMTVESVTSSTDDGNATSTSGLPTYPRKGDTWEIDFTVTDGGDGGTQGFFGYAAPDESEEPDCYYVCVDFFNSELRIQTTFGGNPSSSNIIATTSKSWSDGSYTLEIDWATDDTHTATVDGTTISGSSAAYPDRDGVVWGSSRRAGTWELEIARKV